MKICKKKKRNGWIIVQSTFNLSYKEGMLMIFLFFFHLKNTSNVFVDYMNKQHKCLKFTSEAENDNSFSYLHIKITSVYREPTFSGVFAHYESYFDQTYKKSLIDILLFCCFSVCSDYNLFDLEVENLRAILKKSSYPSGIIEQSIKSFLNKLHYPMSR